MGRVTKFTKATADAICNRIAEGEPLREICREKGMPAWRTVYDWRDADKDFAARFARAREIGFDAIAEDTLAIADTPIEGEEVELDEDGKVTKTKRGDMLGHRKLQVDTRLKLLAKWSPKYGDKQAVELSGPGGGPVEISDTERAARVGSILAAAAKRKADEAGEPV